MRAVFGVRIRHLLVLAPLLSLPAATGFGAQKAAEPVPPLEVRGYELAANQDQPTLCFTLSQTVARRPDAPLESFVSAEPSVKLAAIPRNNRLCLTGFAFGTGYNVSLKAGLPGVTSPLGKDWSHWIQVPNRPPEFDFAGPVDGVLPRAGNDGLPLRSVNVPKIDIDLFRIGEADVAGFSARQALNAGDIENRIGRGERIWHGTIEPKGQANRDTVTAIPVRQAIEGSKPGLYIATARETGAIVAPQSALPTQYFFVSDLGLVTYRGLDSLAVWVRSLATTNPAPGTEIALIGRDNRELARQRTDDNGFVRFEGDILRGAGGSEPTALYAYGQSGDFAALALDQGGQTGAEPVSAIIYPDRSAYRPGETVNILTLLRTAQGGAATRQPLTLTTLRPDGVVFDTRTLTDQGGGYSATIALPAAGASGRWRTEARVEGASDPVGQATFDVGPDMPSNLNPAVSADAAMLDPSQPANLAVQAQYADGQAAPSTPGTVSIKVAASAMPYPAFPAFTFGLSDEIVTPAVTDPVRFITDPAGKALLPVKFAVPALATRPLEAVVTAQLSDTGGRPVTHSMTIPVATQNLVLGVRSTPSAVFDDQTAHFELIALSPDGARQEKKGAGWEILRLDSAPSWQWDGTRFAFRPTMTGTHVDGGTIDIPGNGPATLDRKLPAGRYRLEVFDPEGEAISSVHFMVGWAPAEFGSKPDAVAVKPAKPVYRAGETAEFFVKPPYEADVTLVPADPRIVRGAAVQHIPAAGGTMRLDIPPDAGMAVQLLVTAIAPADPVAAGMTRRAFSSIPLAADPAERQLDVKLDLPAVAAPQTVLAVPVTVAAAPDEAVFVQLFATDVRGGAEETGNPLPPLAALIAKNAEAVTVSDNYGRLITASGLSNGTLGMPAADAPDRLDNTPQPPVHQPLAIATGIVALDKNGAAKLSLALPDFSGTLKLRAIAWSAGRTGQATATLPVHDPLSADLPLPARLAPDDRADLTLTLNNIDGPRGEYRIKLSADGQVALQGDSELVVNLAEHEQRAQPVTIQAKDQGEGTVTLSVTGPNGIAFERRLNVAVSAATARIVRHAQLTLKPGATLTVDPALTAGLRPESIVSQTTFGAGIDFDLNGLAADLTGHALFSAGQIIGEATVWLSPASVLANLGLKDDPQARLTALVRALAAYQTTDGGFSRWGGGASDPWLTAEIADLLQRCKTAGVILPDTMLDQAIARLAAIFAPLATGPIDAVTVPPGRLAEAAYAARVLAAGGRMNLFQLRYFSDRLQAELRDPLSVGLIASSFAILGDKASATAGFARAMSLAESGGSVRLELEGQAALTALMIESGAVAQPSTASFLAGLSGAAGNRRQFSTAEAMWLFRTVVPLVASAGPVKAKIGDLTLQQDHALWGFVKGTPPIRNLADKPAHISLTVLGDPAQGEVRDQGFELQRAFFDTNGKPVDPANIRQNDLLVVVLTGRFTGQGDAKPLLVDPLPAGWRIEAADIKDAANRYPWLKDLGGASFARADDGRLVAIPNLTGERHEFKTAYVVRATVRGQFALPGPTIQDLAQPAQYGRGAAGKTKVDPAS